MRLLFATTANLGHFGPMVPFARACAAAGHEVAVCAPASFAGAVERAGFRHLPVGEPDPAEIGPLMARLPELSTEEANRVVVRDVFAGVDARAALPGVEAAVRGFDPDVVVRELAEFASFVVAQRWDVPQVEIAAALAETDVAACALLDDALARLGCPDDAELLATPLLTSVPESLDATDGLPERPIHRFRYEPPPATARGLPEWPDSSDDPIVYASFGTVAGAAPQFRGVYRALVDALADQPFRVLVTLGESADPALLGPTPDHIRVEPFWPQQDVMPHAAAVIGHGGFGTTMTTLAAGVPQVVVPLFALDQFYNARAVEHAGAGLTVDPELTALTDALSRLVRDGSHRLAARRLAEEIADLPSVAESVAVLAAVRS
jgi:UDP:flavonoid glycosyltransferase YjiC (YdhE family)